MAVLISVEEGEVEGLSPAVEEGFKIKTMKSIIIYIYIYIP